MTRSPPIIPSAAAPSESGGSNTIYTPTSSAFGGDTDIEDLTPPASIGETETLPGTPRAISRQSSPYADDVSKKSGEETAQKKSWWGWLNASTVPDAWAPVV